MISHSSRFTQKTGTWELCPSPLCPSAFQKQLATGQKLGLAKNGEQKCIIRNLIPFSVHDTLQNILSKYAFSHVCSGGGPIHARVPIRTHP